MNILKFAIICAIVWPLTRLFVNGVKWLFSRINMEIVKSGMLGIYFAIIMTISTLMPWIPFERFEKYINRVADNNIKGEHVGASIVTAIVTILLLFLAYLYFLVNGILYIYGV